MIKARKQACHDHMHACGKGPERFRLAGREVECPMRAYDARWLVLSGSHSLSRRLNLGVHDDARVPGRETTWRPRAQQPQLVLLGDAMQRRIVAEEGTDVALSRKETSVRYMEKKGLIERELESLAGIAG